MSETQAPRPDTPNEWKELRSAWWNAIKEPLSKPRFILYFIIFIVVIGNLGMWISLFQNCFNSNNHVSNICISMLTFALGISVTVIGDIILNEPKNENDGKGIEKSVTFSYLCFAIIVIFCALAGWTIFSMSESSYADTTKSVLLVLSGDFVVLSPKLETDVIISVNKTIGIVLLCASVLGSFMLWWQANHELPKFTAPSINPNNATPSLNELPNVELKNPRNLQI